MSDITRRRLRRMNWGGLSHADSSEIRVIDKREERKIISEETTPEIDIYTLEPPC